MLISHLSHFHSDFPNIPIAFSHRPRGKNCHPSFVGSIGFLTTQETWATWGAANVQQCQRLPWTELGNSRAFIFDLTKIIQKLMSNLQKHIFDCPIYTLKSVETRSPSITQVSSPLPGSLLTSSTRTNRTSGVLQPTSDAQSRLCDFHQQATEEDNQWKHGRHQGGDKAHSGTILEKEIWEI